MRRGLRRNIDANQEAEDEGNREEDAKDDEDVHRQTNSDVEVGTGFRVGVHLGAGQGGTEVMTGLHARPRAGVRAPTKLRVAKSSTHRRKSRYQNLLW